MKMCSKAISKWLLVVFLLSFTSQLRADDGMWLLALLKRYNAEELKAMGLKIPVEKLSGESEGALSEAVVAFGSGCTGSIISKSGLVLTNYHCSYGALQQYVSPTNDIILNGFFAQTQGQELPVSDLTVTVNRKILDITDDVKAVPQMGADYRDAIAAVTQKYQQQYPKYKVLIKSYKNNALFVLYLQQQYRDVRLVGTGPKNVTKFGGETDNFMWPRYSCDFAFFRVYADKNGEPASYSKANVPLEVKNYLHISTEGYKKGDFAMSMGYPVMSDRDATSSQIWQKTQVLNPPMIAVRKARQSILEEEMAKSLAIKQLYAEKYALSANYYKNAVGMNYWVDKLNIIAKKDAFEQAWLNWIKQGASKNMDYAYTLANVKAAIEANAKYKRAETYYGEAFTSACDLMQFLSAFGNSFYTNTERLKKTPSDAKSLMANTRFYYKKIDIDVDKRITKAMLKLIKDSLSEDLQPEIFIQKNLRTDSQIDAYVDEVFKSSVFADSTKVFNWIKNPATSIVDDPLAQLEQSIDKKQREIYKIAEGNARKIYRMATPYYSSVAEFKGGRYYPDADKTIRLSYGTISDLRVDDKLTPYQTMLSGLIARAADTLNKDYALNKKLQSIWQSKDFEEYALNGNMPVCFITNGDVTGGNSGSPMMNAEGKIIGLVFDCNWESMTREFNYEKDLHKVICVDIRYLLLIADKFSGSRLVKEIKQSNQ